MNELFGIKYQVSMTPKLWNSKNICGDIVRASGRQEIVPWIYTKEKDVDVIAKYLDGGEVASVVKKLPDGSTSVVLGVPEVNASLWPSLLTLSNIHQYVEGEAYVRANEKMLMVYMPRGGTYTIRLPRKATVVDLFGDMKPLKNTDRFTIKVKTHQTRLFELK